MTGAFLQLRRQRQVAHVHELGVRATGELLFAMAAETGRPDVLDRLLGEYARLTPAQVQAAGGAQFPVAVRVVA